MYVINGKANHSVENSITVSSIYGSMQDFDLNKTLQEVSQEPVPVSLNATFQRFPNPDPIPATFATAIISYCPPNIQHDLAAVKVSGSSKICVF